MADDTTPTPGADPDLENLAEKWYAGAVRTGALEAAVRSIAQPLVDIVAAVLAFVLSILDPIAGGLVKAILTGFNTAAGGTIDTITGIALEEYQQALGGGGGRTGGVSVGAQGIAATFINRIVSTLPPPGAAGIEPTLAPAANFVGMLTELTVRGWVLGLLGELETVGFIKGFEDLVADIVRTIGSGRLTRVALAPFVQAVVSDPAKQYVMLNYRPTLLGESLAARQVIRGYQDRAWLDAELGKAGYSADRISAILDSEQGVLPLAVAWRLSHDGTITADDFATIGTKHGFLTSDAALIARWHELEITDQMARREAAQYLDLVRSGVLTFDEFKDLAGQLQLPAVELAYYVELAQIIVSHARRHLTIAQLGELLSRNIIALSEYRTYLDRLGYSSDDATLIELLEQRTLNDHAAATAARAAATAAKAAAAAQAKIDKAAVAAAKAAALAARRAAAQQLAEQKAEAASQAHLERIQQTAAAAAQIRTLAEQAKNAQLITADQATQAQIQLDATEQESAAQAAAQAQAQTAYVQEQNSIDATAVASQVEAEKVTAKTKAATARANLDQQLLDAKRADRVAAYQLERQSAQDAFDNGELTSLQLARKQRSIDLAEQKDIATEDQTQLADAKAQATADAQIASGQVNIDALTAKAANLPKATQRRQDLITSALASHVATIAKTAQTKTTAKHAAATARMAAIDQANAARDQLDASLAAQKLALEQQIAANRPKPPAA